MLKNNSSLDIGETDKSMSENSKNTLRPVLAGIAGIGLAIGADIHAEEAPVAGNRILDVAREELKLQEGIQEGTRKMLEKLDNPALPFDGNLELQKILLRSELKGGESSIKRAQRKVEELEAHMQKIEKHDALNKRLQRISHVISAREYAKNPQLWDAFVADAKKAFERYEKIQTLDIEDPVRTALIEEMRVAVKEYKTPQGPADTEAIAISLPALVKLNAALNAFDSSFVALVELPAGSAMQFVNDKGEQSPVFDIEADKYDEYPFGIATMTKSEKQTSTVAGVVTWKLKLDPAFKGAVKIRKNGEWISKQVPPVLQAPASQPKVEQKKDEKISEEETAVEDEMIVDPSLIMEVDAPYYEEAVSKKGVRHLMKRYVAARKRHLLTVVADEDRYGACPKYRAFAQVFEQEICEISAYSGFGHADDFDRLHWSKIDAGATECDEAIERMLLTLDRYEREKETFAKCAPKKIDSVPFAPADEASTLKAIEKYKQTMVKRFGIVPAKYATLHECYEEVLKRVKNDKKPDARVISITLNHWRDAARKAALADRLKKDESVSALSSFFGGAMKQATAVTGFCKEMDPIELRQKLIELSATQEFEFALSADALEALIRIKSVVPELVGKDGSFLHGSSAEGKSGDIVGMYASKLEAATAKGQGALKLIEGMTGYDIEIMSNGAFDKVTIDWILASINSPVPFKGIPDGMFICIVRKGTKGF